MNIYCEAIENVKPLAYGTLRKGSLPTVDCCGLFVYTYFYAYYHLRLKHAVKGTHTHQLSLAV